MSKARQLADLGDDFDGTNLTLSGGVYLGGTAAANKLDEVESGTWTVNLYKGGSAIGVTTRYGCYERIGNLLFISFYWYSSNVTTTGSSPYTIQGMPFNLNNSGPSGYQFIPCGYNSLNSTNVHRWQCNITTALELYGSSKLTNVSSSALELSGSGVLKIA